MKKEVKVVELFAGVGGFRLGLEKASRRFKVVLSNQWEPGARSQFASEIYSKRFGTKGHVNADISMVPTSHIPDFDLLVGGFPCQDYSVARTLSQAKGLEGKKGVLWWQIHRIIKEKGSRPMLFLENVDRLLKSPADQRGRDFAIMLASLADLGYIVEWRVINAADYGMPQRRRRVFFLAYPRDSPLHKEVKRQGDPFKWMFLDGTLAKSFRVDTGGLKTSKFALKGSLADLSERFNKDGGASPFENSGIMIDRQIWTAKVKPKFNGKRTLLKDILLPEKDVPAEFFIRNDSLEKWRYLKGEKREKRRNKKGIVYNYSEGSMVFPDSLDAPSRTIVTGEGGATPSRFKHVIKTKSGKLRRLTPMELERLNMFPDNHTKEGTDVQRAFLMGNALVVGVIERIGKTLMSRLD